MGHAYNLAPLQPPVQLAQRPQLEAQLRTEYVGLRNYFLYHTVLEFCNTSRKRLMSINTLGFSYRASSMLYNKSYPTDATFVIFLYLLFLVFPTCFGLLPAHHQGCLQLLFMCCHLVHVVLCCLSACVCSAEWFVVVTTV